jgi:hypothetical protein
MPIAKEAADEVVITLPCHVGTPCERCRDEVRIEALTWLRELNDTYGESGAKVFSMLSSSMQAVHQCQPPQAYLGSDDAMSWLCPDCGTVWHLRVLAEGRAFGQEAGPFLWGEWVPERAG